MPSFSPTQWVARAQRAYRRLQSEGLGVVRDKYQQHRLPTEWSALASASHLFEGKIGVEIGGPSDLFRRNSTLPIYPLGSRVDNCNFSGDTAWVRAQTAGATFVFDETKAPGHQFLCEGSHLGALADAHYDFVLSSHCLEHLANPLLGLTEWRRVLKPAGALLLVVPHKDGTFDHRRPVTDLSHLVLDYERQMPEADLTHLDEVLRLHDFSKDPGSSDFAAFKARCENNLVHRCIHHHVFNTHLAVELVDWVGMQIIHVQVLRPFHIVILAQKPSSHGSKNNVAFLGHDTAPVWQSPLPSDQRNYWRDTCRRRQNASTTRQWGQGVAAVFLARS